MFLEWYSYWVLGRKEGNREEERSGKRGGGGVDTNVCQTNKINNFTLAVSILS